MLRGLNALVFDIQDIGSRSYTYISTLGACMQACAENGIELIVLDRPNLLGGNRIEGNIRESGLRSFVGAYPIPYNHGLTIGELARMINGRGWAGKKRCRLSVVSMRGYRRGHALGRDKLALDSDQSEHSLRLQPVFLRRDRDGR
jgi:uncharacterized protein YbbC (DUF1343 family)